MEIEVGDPLRLDPFLFTLGTYGASYRPEGEEKASLEGWWQLWKGQWAGPLPGFIISGLARNRMRT